MRLKLSCAALAAFLAIQTDGGLAQSVTSNTLDQGRMIFAQPSLKSADEVFHVPLAEHNYSEDHAFNIVLWQPNPNRPDGKLVHTNWTAGDMTGFYPTKPFTDHQIAFRDATGTSTLQVDKGVIGVYLNSADLPKGSPGNKMMIAPAVRLDNRAPLYVFGKSESALINSLDLQVPTAHDENRPGNFTYVTACFVFEDRKTHTQITYEATLFHHGSAAAKLPNRDTLRRTEVGVYDEPSHTYQVGNPLTPISRVVTMLPGSSVYQTQPWRGWQTFDFAITRQNFDTALQSLKEKSSSFTASSDPADYALLEWHLNAELTFGSGPAQLGWSMRNAQVSLGNLN